MKTNWTVVFGRTGDAEYAIVRRGSEDIVTATIDGRGAPRDLEFSDERHRRSNRTRAKAIDVLVSATADRVLA